MNYIQSAFDVHTPESLKPGKLRFPLFTVAAAVWSLCSWDSQKRLISNRIIDQ